MLVGGLPKGVMGVVGVKGAMGDSTHPIPYGGVESGVLLKDGLIEESAPRQ